MKAIRVSLLVGVVSLFCGLCLQAQQQPGANLSLAFGINNRAAVMRSKWELPRISLAERRDDGPQCKHIAKLFAFSHHRHIHQRSWKDRRPSFRF